MALVILPASQVEELARLTLTKTPAPVEAIVEIASRLNRIAFDLKETPCAMIGLSEAEWTALVF